MSFLPCWGKTKNPSGGECTFAEVFVRLNSTEGCDPPSTWRPEQALLIACRLIGKRAEAGRGEHQIYS